MLIAIIFTSSHLSRYSKNQLIETPEFPILLNNACASDETRKAAFYVALSLTETEMSLFIFRDFLDNPNCQVKTVEELQIVLLELIKLGWDDVSERVLTKFVSAQWVSKRVL